MHEYEPSFLQLVFDSLPALVWASDADLNITLMEGSVLPQLGLDEQTLASVIGTRGEAVLGEDAVDIIQRFLPLQQGVPVTFELVFQGRWYSAKAVPLRDRCGKMIGSIGVAVDTTERHAMAEALIRERDALSETQQIAELGSWSRNIDEDRLTISPQLAKLLGMPYTGTSVPLAEIHQRIHPEDAKRFFYELSEGERKRDGFQLDHRIVRPDGTVRHVRTQGAYEFKGGKAERCLGTMIDMTERVEAQLAAEHLAYHDALTNLPNRLLLADRIAQNIALAQREHQVFYVLFVDIDHFKDINDTLGHAQGDVLLVEVANRLSDVTRATDTVARSGGDEFIVLLTDVANEDDLHAAIDKIRSAFVAPFHLSDGDHVMTASIGYAAYPADGSETSELLQRADTAMYDAKRAGRNAVRRFVSESAETNARRMQLEIDLRQALEKGQFRVYYQPIVDARELTLVGAEALLRWQHPTRGLLEPDQFIELAEHGDFILDLGRWVIDEACRQLGRFQNALGRPLRLSVNVAPRQVTSRDYLVEALDAALRESGVEGWALDLELTETALMSEFEAAVSVFARVREMGVGVAIDDFGTGYNSFSYLKLLPVTTLKIDRSFVSMGASAFDEAISNAIATLGRSIGLRVVAEGVETKAQCALMQSMGCDALQGFFFARPLPPDELIERYANGSAGAVVVG